MKRRTKVFMKWGFAVCIAVVAGVNILAFFHANAMTHWADENAQTPLPEDFNWAQRAGVLATGVKIPRPANFQKPESLGLQFSTHRIPNGQEQELEAWFIPADQAEVLFVLFHGYAASKESMLPVAAELHGLGYATLLVDFYGSGGSSGHNTTLGVAEARDVQAVVQFGRRQWPHQSMVLYGQSMGGAAILRAVARYGVAPDGLVIESVFDRLVTTVRSRFRSMNLPSTPFAQLLVFWGGARAGFDGFEHNPVEYATAVQCPTLVLHGGLDLRVSTDEAKSVYNELGGWKRFLDIESAGHHSVVAVSPEAWKRELGLLVEQIPVGRRSN